MSIMGPIAQTYGFLSLYAIIPAIILAIVCIVVAKQVLKLLGKMLERSKVDKSLHAFIKAVAKILVYFIVILIVASSLGINVTSLIAVLSVAGLAVSLAVQGSLSNVAGGLVILTTKPFAVGDYVECGGNSGTITEIGLMSTKMLTVDNRKVVIPNSDISAARIINYSSEGKRRVDLAVSTAYSAGIDEVKAAVTEAAKNVANVLTDDEIFVRVNDYKDSTIEYAVRVWCKNADYWQVHFDLLEEIKKSFDRHGIEMSYPHVNVHMLEK